MGMEFNVRMTGFRELNIALMILPDNLKAQALKSGVRAGAKVIRDIARQKARRGKTGRLRKGIIHKLRRGTKNEVLASVGWNMKIAPHGHLVELGHTIVARGKMGQSNRGGKVIGHVPAYPHLRPALVMGRLKAIRAVRKQVNIWILRRAARA